MTDSRAQFYERFADAFDEAMNPYDLETRLRVVFRELPDDLTGVQLLDAGCGTGHFSRAASERGARVVSVDLGPRLLRKTAEKCASGSVVGSVLALPFADCAFDAVISSEVIEHVPDPETAFAEMARVLKPGGRLVLTTPNRFWRWSVTVANRLGLRPYQGLENWVAGRDLRRWAERCELETNAFYGFHLFPFQLRWSHAVLRACDRYGRVLRPIMVNQALAAVKRST